MTAPSRPIDPSVPRLVHIAESARSADPFVLRCEACGLVVRVLRDDEMPPAACPCGAPVCEECQGVLAAARVARRARHPAEQPPAFHMRKNVRGGDPIAFHCDVCGGVVMPTTGEVEAWTAAADRFDPHAIRCPVCGTLACTGCFVVAMTHRRREGWTARFVGVA